MLNLDLLLAASLALVAAAATFQLVWGSARVTSLADVPPLAPGASTPRVSVVVAARDEERHVEAAVTALLDQAYPDYELVVVDDRSTDGTPAILRALAERHERLAVVRVDSLPDGWLGKNHALQRGAEIARGELILFADADVILAPDALSRAVRLIQHERAHHLALAPDIDAPTGPLAAVVSYFMMWFLLHLRAWKASDPQSRAYVGIGAFNLVRASAWRAVGGHTRIALRPDDDLMLGKLLKRTGHRQLVATADGLVRVEWNRTLTEMARGLRKNAFAGLHYSLPLAVAGATGVLLLTVWPFAAMWLATGVAQWLYAFAAAVQLACYGTQPLVRRRPWLALLYPVAGVLFVWMLVSAVTRTLLRGGIEWRGTFYPLPRLRANRV